MPYTDKKPHDLKNTSHNAYATRLLQRSNSGSASAEFTRSAESAPTTVQRDPFGLRSHEPETPEMLRERTRGLRDPVYNAAADILVTPGRDRRWAFYTPSPDTTSTEFISANNDCGDKPTRSSRPNKPKTASRAEKYLRNITAVRSAQSEPASEPDQMLSESPLYFILDPSWDESQDDLSLVFVSAADYTNGLPTQDSPAPGNQRGDRSPPGSSSI